MGAGQKVGAALIFQTQLARADSELEIDLDRNVTTTNVTGGLINGCNCVPVVVVPSLRALQHSVGSTMRLQLRLVVLPLLGFDFGYGVERNGFELYLAIGRTDSSRACSG